MCKVAYRVQNWKQYNRALISRGNLTLWVSEEVMAAWYATRDPGAERGRPKTYSDACIELGLTLRTLFRLPLRATQGFVEGLLQMMGLRLEVPSYTQLSRRAAKLEIQLSRQPKSGKLDLVIDSTGLKIYGEGEWKMRIHGKQKRRTWRKLHVAVDPATHEIVAQKLTEANVHDSEAVPDLMKGLENQNLGNVYGDGAYPTPKSLDAITAVGGHAIIPPRTGTCIVKDDPSPGELQRNRLVRERRVAGGKKAWKRESGYHRRSLVETHMFRQKVILGEKLYNRCFKNQKTEARIRASILNRMTTQGMPRTCKITL